MVASMGPFWGAISLAPSVAEQAWSLQRQYYDFSINEQWNQTHQLVRAYYARRAPSTRRGPLLKLIPTTTTCTGSRLS